MFSLKFHSFSFFQHHEFASTVQARVAAMAKQPPKSLMFSKQLIRGHRAAQLHQVGVDVWEVV